MKLAYLLESRFARLYHGTTLFGLANILRTGYVYKGSHLGRPLEPDGVRLTTDVQVAKDFAYFQDYPGGIVWFDGLDNVPLTPYADKDGETSYEREREIVAEVTQLPIQPGNVAVLPQAIEALDDLNEADYNWIWNSNTYHFESPEDVKSALDELRSKIPSMEVIQP